MEAVTRARLKQGRAGSRVLALLSVPLNGLIVRALGEGERAQADLRQELGNPAQTTLRGHLSRLESLGAVRRAWCSGRARRPVYELTAAGGDLLIATRALEAWLDKAPLGPIPLGSEPAKGAVKALAGAWDSTVLRALAGAPLSLVQLDSLIGPLSYPALERRLSAMRAAGLAEEAARGGGRDGVPYAVTAWARQGIGLIASAAHFECAHMETDTPEMTSIDIEAAFLLATPVVPIAAEVAGSCDLIAATGETSKRLAGVQVEVDRGKVTSCVACVGENPRNWVLGSVASWLGAVVNGQLAGLRIGGDRSLACALVYGLHTVLFA